MQDYHNATRNFNGIIANDIVTICRKGKCIELTIKYKEFYMYTLLNIKGCDIATNRQYNPLVLNAIAKSITENKIIDDLIYSVHEFPYYDYVFEHNSDIIYIDNLLPEHYNAINGKTIIVFGLQHDIIINADSVRFKLSSTKSKVTVNVRELYYNTNATINISGIAHYIETRNVDLSVFANVKTNIFNIRNYSNLYPAMTIAIDNMLFCNIYQNYFMGAIITKYDHNIKYDKPIKKEELLRLCNNRFAKTKSAVTC